MARRLVFDSKKSEGRQVLSVLIPSDSMNASEDARSWLREQFSKVWQELKGGRLKVEERLAARLVAQNLDALDKVERDFAGGKADTLGLRCGLESGGIRTEECDENEPSAGISLLKGPL